MFNKFAAYEEVFACWRRDGMTGLMVESYTYVDFLTSPDDDEARREGTLWPHQWDTFLHVVYAYEILGKVEIGCDGLLRNIVTDSGKTAEITALTSWLHTARPTPARGK